MTSKSKHEKINQMIAIILFYGMVFTFIVPVKILAGNYQNNSPISSNNNSSKQIVNPQADKSFGSIPVYFEENRGQFDKRVKYFARETSGYSLFLTATEAVYVLNSPKSEVQSPKSETDELTLDSGLRTQDSATAVFMKLVGANENSGSIGLEEMPHKTNYFKGNDESKWRTGIPNFKQVQINNVYQGIDTVWQGKENGAVQYDFVIKPNADPNRIEWEIDGAESVEIDEKGDLLINTETGTIRQNEPFSYQETNGFKQEAIFRNGTWYVLRNDNSFYTSQFGSVGDIPIP